MRGYGSLTVNGNFNMGNNVVFSGRTTDCFTEFNIEAINNNFEFTHTDFHNTAISCMPNSLSSTDCFFHKSDIHFEYGDLELSNNNFSNSSVDIISHNNNRSIVIEDNIFYG